MPRLLKCYGQSCLDNDLKYPKEELQAVNGKNYCVDHYDQAVREANNKALDETYRKKLYYTIGHYYNLPKKRPTAMMMNQIKRFHSNGFSYEELYEAFEYGKTVENNDYMKYGVYWIANYVDTVNQLKAKKTVKSGVEVTRKMKVHIESKPKRNRKTRIYNFAGEN